MKWQFTTPSAPHQNGCSEAMVKTVKKALKKAIGDTVLTPFELYTCLLEVANLVNQRPIGRIPNDPDDGAYLCPNDILLGRASSTVPQGPFRRTENPIEWDSPLRGGMLRYRNRNGLDSNLRPLSSRDFICNTSYLVFVMHGLLGCF